ncbi:hypothetical protein QBC38DRAFT_157578 [Podospora fimiseda]|uniref:Mitotic apparatus protein p62 n=1 Tax=Podospora fimiseda TaxID=252190 RepID=A0AAN7BS26_9PEZI|nr:hypothetical protein QBC38DRAFT_157578 [Podospora fimiseda]
MAAKVASHIIRIPRTNEDGSFVLGEVTPSPGTSKPLNVKFLATEGDEPYVVKLRHDHIGELIATNTKTTPPSAEEWEKILIFLLLRGDPVEDIEAVAEAKRKKSIVITIRRRVAGINQRLGSITLDYKKDEIDAISLYDWCGAVVQERENLKEQLISETAKTSGLESRIADLRHQLEELTQAKKERETELLQKFCDLLNEKKVKIREQQKLLNSANIGSSKLSSTAAKVAQLSVNSSQEESRVVSSRSRTATKRKAAQRDDDSDSDDGFEKASTAATDEMDIDEPPPAQKDPSPQALPEEDRVTSDDEDATGSEPDEDDEPVPSQSAPSPPPTRRKAADKDVSMQTMHNLRNRSPAPTKAKVSPPANGSETESDDDEL